MLVNVGQFVENPQVFIPSVIPPEISDRFLSVAAKLYLFTTMLHRAALGALLTWSAVPWYPSYESTAVFSGFDAIEDQQLGGLVMWIPGALTYLIAGLALAAHWLRDAQMVARR